MVFGVRRINSMRNKIATFTSRKDAQNEDKRMRRQSKNTSWQKRVTEAEKHISKDDQEWIKAMVRYASLKSKLAELNEMESVKSK